MNDDTKMLLSVASLVALGAIGLALVASCSAERTASRSGDDQPSAAAETRMVAAAPSGVPHDAGHTGDATPALATLPQSTGFAPAENEASQPPPEDLRPRFEIDPDADRIAAALASYGNREYERAAAYLRAEIEAGPARAWTYYMLGLSAWKSGDPDAAVEAVEAMQRAIELDPAWIKPRVNLARIENDRGKFEAALAASRAALALDAESAEALFLEARSLYNLQRTEEALASLQASLSLDPDNGYARNLHGLILLEQGRVGEAVSALEVAVEVAPAVAFIHNNLGMALERSGRRVEAVAAYRAAVEADAGHAKAAHNLARLEPPVPDSVETAATASKRTETPPATEPAVGDSAAVPESEAVSAGEPSLPDPQPFSDPAAPLWE